MNPVDNYLTYEEETKRKNKNDYSDFDELLDRESHD
jgi:hypothetical protein